MEVQIGKSLGEVSEYIYGQFVEHILNCISGGLYDSESIFADSDGVRADVVEKLNVLAPPVMRFPGGTIMCQYHWEDAVGPAEQRVRRKNLIWGGELDPAFGTAEFIKFCRKINAEPMLCVNMASGTPEEAANWVEYCNGAGNTHYANLRKSHGYPEPFNVRFWCIGNECYAEPDIGIQHDVNIYVRDAMEFIKWMKLTDPSIQTIVVGCDDERWNRTVLDKLHAVTDYLSYHHYSGENGMGLYGPFAGEKALICQVERLKKLIDEYPETVADFSPWYRFPPRKEKIKIALDEWNIWNFQSDETYGLLQTYNWRDALWTASVLNQLIMRPEIGMANLAQSVNVIAPIVAEREGSWYQTIAYPLLHYRRTMLGERMELQYVSPIIDGGKAGELNAVSLAAVQQLDGTVCIAAVNRDFEHDLRIEIKEAKGKTAVITCLYASEPEDICSLHSNCVRECCYSVAADETITLRRASIMLIQISQKQKAV